MKQLLKAPFPWFGGKSQAAGIIWSRMGDVPNWCCPFFGSGATEWARPHAPGVETVNDKDCYLANFWREHYPKIKSELGRKYPKHLWR